MQTKLSKVPDSDLLSVHNSDNLYHGFIFSSTSSKIRFEEETLQIYILEDDSSYLFEHKGQIQIDPEISLEKESFEAPKTSKLFNQDSEISILAQNLQKIIPNSSQRQVQVKEQVLKQLSLDTHRTANMFHHQNISIYHLFPDYFRKHTITMFLHQHTRYLAESLVQTRKSMAKTLDTLALFTVATQVCELSEYNVQGVCDFVQAICNVLLHSHYKTTFQQFVKASIQVSQELLFTVKPAFTKFGSMLAGESAKLSQKILLEVTQQQKNEFLKWNNWDQLALQCMDQVATFFARGNSLQKFVEIIMNIYEKPNYVEICKECGLGVARKWDSVLQAQGGTQGYEQKFGKDATMFLMMLQKAQ